MSVMPGSIPSPASSGLMPPSGSASSINMTMSPASLIPSHSPGPHVTPSPARMLANALSPGAVNTPGKINILLLITLQLFVQQYKTDCNII